jgi:O-antigen ligase
VLSLSLLLTNSRSSIAMVVALWAAVYLLRWRRLYLLIFGISVLLLGAVVAIPAGDEVLKLVSRSGDVGEITSMTGRSTIWHAIPALVETRPWTGYGYASSIVVLPEHEREVGFLTTHAHNLALQLLLTTGWVGLGLFSLTILTTGLRLAFFADRTGLVMLAFVILNGLTESSAFCTLANICTVAFAIAVTLPPEKPYYEDDHPY